MEITRVIKNNNPGLYYSNLGVVDIILYGLRPKVNERAFSAWHLYELIESYEAVLNHITATNENKKRTEAGTTDIDKKLKIIQRKISQETKANSNNILLRILERDVLKLERQFSTIARKEERVLYEVPGGNREELINHLLLSLGSLRKGDEIKALTTPAFWYRQNFGPDGRILTMVKIAALNGVKIHWLLVLDEKDWKDYFRDERRGKILQVDEVLKSQKNTMLELRKMIPTASADVQVKYSEVEPEVKNKIIAQAQTFILLKHNNSHNSYETLIAPTYVERGGQIASVRFWRNPFRAEYDFEQVFVSHWGTAKNILDYVSYKSRNKSQ
jgi:hypothetical protein